MKLHRKSENKLSVLVPDSLYSQRDFIGEQVQHKNFITVTRVRSNRVFYRQFIREQSQKKQLWTSSLVWR